MEIILGLMNMEVPFCTKAKNMMKGIIILFALYSLCVGVREVTMMCSETKQEGLESLNTMIVAGGTADMIDSIEFRLPEKVTKDVKVSSVTPAVTATVKAEEKALPQAYEKTGKDKTANDKAEIDKIVTGPIETDEIETDNNVEDVLPDNNVTEISGFLINDSGYITGYTDVSLVLRDGLLILPSDESCHGVENGAFDGLAGEVTELYIPANISYISPGTFDQMSNLIYIEAASENNNYYSEDGILYHRDGSVAVYPNGR